MKNDLLEFYSEKWNLTYQNLVTETATSILYEVRKNNDSYILKILNEVGKVDEAGGAIALKAWDGNGSVNLVESDEDALLLEKLDLPNLYSFSEINKEDRATEVFIDIIKKIHSITPDQYVNQFVGLDKVFDFFDKTPSDIENREMFPRAQKVAKNLLETTSKQVLLHGDLHHENVMRRTTSEYVCIDPKGYIGDPSYEIATILKNPWAYPEISESEIICLKRAKSFSKQLQLPLDRILSFAFVHMCLSVLWSHIDGSREYSHQMKIATFLSKHV